VLVSVVRERVEAGHDSDGSTRVYTADDEDIRSSGLSDGGLMMYTTRCRCGVQANR
jgi:hypothetical protein